MSKLTVEDLEIKGRRVLMRVDFNVPLEEGKVANDKRIRAALPTIDYILDKGGRLILMSHLGRPSGEPDPKFSLAPIATHLDGLIGVRVQFVSATVGDVVEQAISSTPTPGVVVLENTRFMPGEKKNDPFSRS